MKYVGMVLGALLSMIGHMIAFMFKNIFIAIRRFSMDPANKNIIWNMQAFSMLLIMILCFLWIVGRYQDIIYGVSEPVFFRAIPLLIPCFLGHMIYSCPALFKNTYAKPVLQTFLNALSVLALGQIVLKYMPTRVGLFVDAVLLIGAVAMTLYYTLHMNIRSTVFNKLVKTVESAVIYSNDKNDLNKVKDSSDLSRGLEESTVIDLNQEGCLKDLRYYSEDCKLELFQTVPTKDRQSELIVLNRNDRAQHGQIIGGTGAGKTLLATNLVTQDLLNDYIGSTIIEPKGSFINRLANFMDRTGRKYFRLDPEFEFTDCLNPFFVPEGQDIEPMIEANVSAFHGYLGPEAEQYFKSRATQLLRVGIKALKIVYGNNCTYNDLDRLIQPVSDDFRAEVMSVLRGRESEVPLLLEYTRNMAGSQKLQEHAMQTYSSLYDYLSELTSNKYIQRIFCGKSTFNIDDALQNGDVVLVNGAYGTLQTLTYTVGRLYLNLLRASTFRRNLKEKVRPHQLTVDEIEMFADEEFSTFLEMAREFEVFVNVIHQGNVQLDDVSERLGTMVKQNAVQKFILAGLDNDDAEYYADMIGETYKIGTSSGTDEMSSTGFKTQIKEEKRYDILPSEILKLKGYNPETGEYGECLFRGVQNNIRMSPVIGMVYPLPRKLFAPLKPVSSVSGEGDIQFEEENQPEINIEKNNAAEKKQDGKQDDKQKQLLERIKQQGKGLNEKTKKPKAETTEVGELQKNEQNVIRSKAWDEGDEDERTEIKSQEQQPGVNGKKEGEHLKDKDSKPKFVPATVGDPTLLKIAATMMDKGAAARGEREAAAAAENQDKENGEKKGTSGTE